MVGRDPKVGRGTRIFNIQFYESPKIETRDGSRPDCVWELRLYTIDTNEKPAKL